MATKKSLPAPIDRPLSRAYLRKFTGWSTAFPPGVSDPGSLRVMENLLINRDGSVRIRPGLRPVMGQVGGAVPYGPGIDLEMVGTHESFYLDNGNRAYLFAARSPATFSGSNRVYFFYGEYVSGRWKVTAVSAGGSVFGTEGFPGDGLASFSETCTYVKYVQIDNKILALSNAGEPFIVFHVGATKKAVLYKQILMPWFTTAAPGPLERAMSPGLASGDWVNGGQSEPPTYVVSSPNSVISSDPTKNIYNLGLFITYSNELGETEPSNIHQLKMQRPWGNWKFEATNNGTTASEPNGTLTQDGIRCGDQIVVSLDFAANGDYLVSAIRDGATHVNLYLMAWSDQSPVPVEGVLVHSKKLVTVGTPATMADVAPVDKFIQLHPGLQFLDRSLPIPTESNRTNYTAPASAAQGLVAADRLILVNDPTAAAVIRWTTNAAGDYLNFSSSRGGGKKTLTSGNMQIPATVKLWQNPQSADTIIVLNKGTDGHSTSYYMAPASVSSQSDNTQIMGFEETTATPGTVAPYGCEVANNALYHPLDDQLMKSTASNYNITHKSMTDDIANMWRKLGNKARMVSCFFDQRLYFLVYNQDGAPLPQGCNGNEIWVLDLSSEGGSWSRWMTPGVSLRKVAVGDREYLSLVRPDGVYVFDDEMTFDRLVDDVAAGTTVDEPIAWQLETNTQGANRAHDAWAHLRQVSLTLGSFTGRMRYGIRGQDMNGRWVEVEKVYIDQRSTEGPMPFDAEDHLHVARELKEWSFFASSTETAGAVDLSSGQVSLVQYRYTPVSVNVGYDYGQVETFEYSRAVAGAETETVNGVPTPYLDTRRP